MNKKLLLLTIIISLSALIVSLYSLNRKKTIFFVNNGKLYDGFILKKEYENQIQKIRTSRKNMMDSVEFAIRQMESQKMTNEARIAQEFYLEKAKQFETDEENMLAEYNQQIWRRLNQYADEYAKEKQLDILLGASGNGNILHGNERIDLTNELIAYANKKYNGK